MHPYFQRDVKKCVNVNKESVKLSLTICNDVPQPISTTSWNESMQSEQHIITITEPS
jgi:hypothetical protein